MKQKIINKIFFVAVVKNNKVIEIIRGRCLEDIEYTIHLKYRNVTLQVMEYNDENDVYVPDVEEQLMMIRRRQANLVSK